MIIWPAETASGWVRYIASSAWKWGLFKTGCVPTRKSLPMLLRLLMARIRSLVSITCVTTWLRAPMLACNEATISLSSTKLTPSSLTKRVRPLSFQVRARRRLRHTISLPALWWVLLLRSTSIWMRRRRPLMPPRAALKRLRQCLASTISMLIHRDSWQITCSRP
ncbi:hypothetical protein SDC9_172914 [bioreactor metagenome]|uniref:Uncharacterized protein n=1 Tax=bioreactor metagenome TaxID=1076179 RepID=A0A645GP80_9ZZZZ